MANEKQLKFKKDGIIDELLTPVSKVTDVSTFVINNEGITAVCSNDSNIILYAKYSGCVIDGAEKINIPDIKKFIRVVSIIPEEDINLGLNSNTLNYKSPKLKFKYHLAEDSMVPITKISIAKITALTFDCKFIVSKSKVQEILKCSSITTDSNKLYFTIDDEGVKSELTDLQSPQTDSVSIHITDEFEGNRLTTPLPISLDIFKLITGVSYDNILVKMNTDLKILMFEIQLPNSKLKYIISSLVK